jgi:hypothetical protein
MMLPTPEETREWYAAVYSLRSVAVRVLGHKPRPALKGARVVRIGPLEADAVVRSYVAMCCPVLQTSAKPLRSFDRVALAPLAPEDACSFGDSARLFWAAVFGSMMPGFGAAVCSDCGRVLSASKSGRRSRALRCPACRQAAYRAQFTDEQWRERNRLKMAAWRANNKGE